MPNLFKRLRNLRTILQVRVGQGAAILPNPQTATPDQPAVTRLHLTYARKIYGGHQGARHFWRQCLPRLKYYNPGVRMSVKQTMEQEGPAALSVYFAHEPTSAVMANSAEEAVKDGFAPVPEGGEKRVVLNVRDQDWKGIWGRLQTVTGAGDVEPSKEELDEVKKLEQMREQSSKDRERVGSIRQKKKDQEEMLKKARGEVEMLRQL